MNNIKFLWENFRKHFVCSKEEYLKIAEFCNKHCKEMKDLVLKTADETAENTFLFRLPWDMESTSETVHFDGKIKWNYCHNEDEEFIFQLNRHRYFICLGQAYRLTGDETYVKAFVRELTDWISENIDITTADKKVWRTLETGLRADYWVRAMALVADSSLITDKVKESFFSALAVQAKHLAENPKKGFSIKSNWGVMEYTGLYVLSLVLDNKNFRETAVYFLKMALHTQIHEDGMQLEASPMYHNEVLAAYLEVLRVANLYEDEPFSEEEKKIIKNMVYATLVHTYPNHHQLMTGDSDDTDVRDIISEAAVLFNEPEFKFAGFKHLDFEGAWLYGTKGIEAYENLEISAISGGLTICAESGEAIWRKSYNDDSDFLYFRNGSLGGGHGHQDKLHVEVWFDGEEILRDSGRYTYKDIDERYVLKSAKAHNVPVINDSEYAPSRDSWTYENLPPSMGNIFSKKEGFLLFEGFHCGYIKEGVLLRRRVAAPKSDIIIISDEIIGNKGNTLSQNFAFAEHISLSKENDLIIGKGIKSEFIIKSFDERGEVAAEIGKAPISRHYNEMRKSSALKMETKNSYFLTTIIAKNVSEEKADIAKENVHNYAYEITLKEDEAQGYLVTRNSEQYGVVLLKDDVGNHKDLNGIRGIYGLGQTMAAALHENPKYMTVLRW